MSFDADVDSDEIDVVNDDDNYLGSSDSTEKNTCSNSSMLGHHHSSSNSSSCNNNKDFSSNSNHSNGSCPGDGGLHSPTLAQPAKDHKEVCDNHVIIAPPQQSSTPKSAFSIDSLLQAPKVPRGRRPNSKYPRVQASKSMNPLSLGMLPLYPPTQPVGFQVQSMPSPSRPFGDMAPRDLHMSPITEGIIASRDREQDLSTLSSGDEKNSSAIELSQSH